MKSLANPSWNCVEAPKASVPILMPVPIRRPISVKEGKPRKKCDPYFRGTKSGYKGVLYVAACKKRPWKAYVDKDGQRITVGYFATKEEAARAYNTEALRLFGADTHLNTIERALAEPT